MLRFNDDDCDYCDESHLYDYHEIYHERNH